MIEIICGDSREVLKAMPEASLDACVCDPPYGLEFMGKEWDAPWKGDRRQTFDGTLADERENPFQRSKVRYGQGASYRAAENNSALLQQWHFEWANEVFRVLKPGAYLLAFSGTRTYHRMVCAIEDAGFEIRDQIGWAYGQGFPKSKNLDGDHKGWGTALKPAWEPIVVARKPLIGTVEANVRAHGTGAMNIDACRVAINPDVDDPRLGGHGAWKTDKAAANVYEGGYAGSNIASSALGRWPANLCHDGSDEVLACFPDSKGQQGDVRGNEPSAPTGEIYGQYSGCVPAAARNDAGSAARFFYCAKASRSERNANMGDADEKPMLWSSGTQNPGSFQSKGTKKSAQNNHPTVKPVALMRWLCRLVTPPGGRVLDPFAGSGTTGLAAQAEGFNATLIELNPEYVEIARRRIEGDRLPLLEEAP